MSIINKIKELFNAFKIQADLKKFIADEMYDYHCFDFEDFKKHFKYFKNEILRQRDYYKRELETVCKVYEIETLIDNVSGDTVHRCRYEILASDYRRTIDKLDTEIKTKIQELEEIKKYLGISDKTIMQRLEELQERRDELSEENEELKNATVTLAEGLNFQQERADKLEQVLDEIKRDITSTCENCRQTYYNQHCEECNKGYILNIINEVKANKNKVGSKVTNRDKLNRMSNEEFANWLTDNDNASELVNCKMCLFCASDKYDDGKWECIQCCDGDFRCKLGIIRWLNQESEQ